MVFQVFYLNIHILKMRNMMEMAVTEAVASVIASQYFVFYVPFAVAKDGRLRFRLPRISK